MNTQKQSSKQFKDSLKRAKSLLSIDMNEEDAQKVYALIEESFQNVDVDEYVDNVWNSFKNNEEALLNLLLTKTKENQGLAYYLLSSAEDYVDNCPSEVDNHYEMLDMAGKYGNSKLKCVVAKEYMELTDYKNEIEWITGFSTEDVISKASSLFLLAADEGDSNGMLAYASMYLNGMLNEEHKEKAMEYLTKAAKSGNAEAQFNLGLYCMSDLQQPEEGIGWIKEAAQNGNDDAMYYLGDFCEQIADREGTENFDEAVEWYIKAAEKGNAIAQWKLVVEFGFENYDMKDIICALQEIDSNPLAMQLLRYTAEHPEIMGS